MFHNLFDSHSHSEHSVDGSHSVTFMVENAIERGLQGLAITDHCDCDEIESLDVEARMAQSAIRVAMAKAAFANQIILTGGIELGHPAFDYAGAEKIMKGYPFDFALLSLHRIRGWDSFYLMDFGDLGEEGLHKLVLAYFDDMLDTMVRWNDYDVLAHLTLPLRYMKLYNDITIDLGRYREPIDAVLKLAADKGKGIEINLSGLFNAMEQTLPPGWIIRRFRELGGELVTIGSDAHNAADVGRGLQQGMGMLAEAGYTHFAFYRHRQPFMLRII